MMNLKVIKREGGEEDWSFDKLLASITKAGMDLEEAKHLASLIEAWAKRASEEGKIKWSDIRDRVIQFLKLIDPVAADAYETYKK